jgi:hypothetical protein
MRRLATFALLFAVVSATLSCAAMATPVAPQHPCCPASQHPDSDRCVRTGCIGTVPFVTPSSADSIVPMPAVAVITPELVAEIPLHEWVPAPLSHPPEIGLFVAHHQLLI